MFESFNKPQVQRAEPTPLSGWLYLGVACISLWTGFFTRSHFMRLNLLTGLFYLGVGLHQFWHLRQRRRSDAAENFSSTTDNHRDSR